MAHLLVGMLVWGQGLELVERADVRDWLRGLNAAQVGIVEKLNRADRRHLERLPAVVRPAEWPADELDLSPMKREDKELAGEAKAIRVDLKQQVFGAYEQGRLVRWGPVSSGAKKMPTPAGEYWLNWRAKRHVSTANSKWVLDWYFNFENREGRALHAYEMPGEPASHSCVRLLPRDAKWIHEWGEGWELGDEGRTVLKRGTRVLIEGAYDFGSAPPWRLVMHVQ
jgi:hypothetical protein